jgi:Glycosyl transferase family 2
MPTANRRRFVSQAIRYFLAQEYSNKELLIVDDGEEAVGDLVPEDARIRYIRLPRKSVLGENAITRQRKPGAKSSCIGMTMIGTHHGDSIIKSKNW